MGKYRGWMVTGVLFLTILILSPTLNAVADCSSFLEKDRCEDLDCVWEKFESHRTKGGPVFDYRCIGGNTDTISDNLPKDNYFSFERSLGIYVGDDDGTCSGTIDRLLLHPYLNEDTSVTGKLSNVFLAHNGNEWCTWQQLPYGVSEQVGCYFISEEKDDNANDCTLVEAPIGATINYISKTAKGHLFQNNDALLTSRSHNALFPGIDMNPEGNDQDGEPAGNNDGWCGITYSTFQAKNSYRCSRKVDNPEEKVWYICDKDHLTINTQKYLPYYIRKGSLDEDQAAAASEEEARTPPPSTEDQPTSVPADGVAPPPDEVPFSEQEIDPTWGWFCVDQGTGNYGWEKSEITCDLVKDTDQSCANTKVHCEANGYSWDESNDDEHGGKCCGDDQSDYGQLNADGSKICLPKSDQSFGVGSDEQIFDQIIAQQTLTCGDTTTCWVDAKGGTLTTQTILTIRPSGTTPYDIVSDGIKWHTCDGKTEATSERPLTPNSATDSKFKPSLKGLYCYQAGNHWEWAHCKSPEGLGEPNEEKPSLINPSIKTRLQGDALRSLYLEPALTSTPAGSYTISKDNSGVADFYGSGAYLDFTGYTKLDLFIQLFLQDPETGKYAEHPATFEELRTRLPLDVKLKIMGPKNGEEDIVYLDQSIIGDHVNMPYWNMPLGPNENYDNNYLHLQVSIPGNLAGISQIEVYPSTGLGIKVSNIYLQNDQETKYCSGFESDNPDVTTNWLDDYDISVIGSSGQRMCTTRFGPNAWLGYEEVDKDQSHCCGDDGPEYYSGDSKAIGDPAVHYGCFNGQPIAHGASSSLIKFTTTSIQKDSTITYPDSEEDFKLLYKINNDEAGTITHADGTTSSMSINDHLNILQTITGKDWIYDRNHDQFIYEESFSASIPYGDAVNIKDFVLGGDSSWDVVEGDTLIDSIELDVPEGVSASITLNNKEIPVPIEISNYVFNRQTTTFGINAKLNYPKKAQISMAENQYFPNEFSLSCSQQECLFPLPPSTWSLTNKHPELYEIYAIGSENILHLASPTYENAAKDYPQSILVRRVPKQVLFIRPNLDDTSLSAAEAEETPGFYSCGQPLPIEGATITPAPRCKVLANQFCAPSVSKEGKTQINSWSAEPLTRMGYILPADQATFEADPLKLATQISELPQPIQDPNAEEQTAITWDAANRTNLTRAVPARNILPNPEFKYGSNGVSPTEEGMRPNDLPYWTIFKNGVPVDNEKKDGDAPEFVNDKSITISQGYSLVSDRIAIENNLEPAKKLKLVLTTGATWCNITIHTVDKAGNPNVSEPFNRSAIIAHQGEIDIGDAISAYIEIRPDAGKTCLIVSPNLQLLLPDQAFDGLGEDPLTREDEPSRAGVACCPNNGCWNGYACVQEFTQSSFLVEKTGKNNKYRCTNGEWTDEPVKYDWLGLNYGYCPQKSDCFVLSSLPKTAGTTAGLPNKTPINFYQGQIPMCIPNSTYILDHYCDNGNWTSRTSYVASAMMDLKGDEYTLFCGLPTQVNGSALTERENNAIFNNTNPVVSQEQGLIGPMEQQDIPVSVCYPNVKTSVGEDTEAKLVFDSENTCINKMCVLKKNDGTTYLATSLNPYIPSDAAETDLGIFAHPFFNALNIAPDKTSCGDPDPNYEKCQVSGDLIPSGMGILYSPALNITLYGPDLAPGTIQATWTAIKGFFSSLFGIEQPTEENQGLFLNHSKNIDGVYAFKNQDKEIQAIKEQGNGTIIINATYAGYDTPLCPYTEYLRNANQEQLPWKGIQGEVLEENIIGARLTCTDNESGVQRIGLVVPNGDAESANNFFTQITAKLRVQE